MSLEVEKSDESEYVYNTEEINNWDELDISKHILNSIS